jgi:hypothetical protein
VIEYLALTAMVGLFAGLIIRLRRRAARSRRAIASLRAGGWAEIRGCVRGRELASDAPISGRRGLGWRVLVEEESGMHGWVPIVDRSEFDDFEVEDKSGSIRVRASDTPITLEVAELRGRGGPFAPPPAAVERLIAEAASPRGVLFHKGFRWREWVLSEGREVVVRARVVSVPGEESLGYRQLSEELVLAGGAARPIEVSE